jgi:hypothetical protein
VPTLALSTNPSCLMVRFPLTSWQGFCYWILMAIEVFFLVSWGGVRLSPLVTSATVWPIVPAVWSSRWNENWQRKPKYSEKTCPCATLSTTNPTRPELGSSPGRRGGKPATNRLCYGYNNLKEKQNIFSRRKMEARCYLGQICTHAPVTVTWYYLDLNCITQDELEYSLTYLKYFGVMRCASSHNGSV